METGAAYQPGDRRKQTARYVASCRVQHKGVITAATSRVCCCRTVKLAASPALHLKCCVDVCQLVVLVEAVAPVCEHGFHVPVQQTSSTCAHHLLQQTYALVCTVHHSTAQQRPQRCCCGQQCAGSESTYVDAALLTSKCGMLAPSCQQSYTHAAAAAHLILSSLCVTLTTLTTRALLGMSLGSNMRVRV